MVDVNKYEGHTPGPWCLDDRDDGASGYILRGSDGDLIEYIEHSRYFHDIADPEQEANARLIADAPMLAAAVAERDAQIAGLVGALREIAEADLLEVKSMRRREFSVPETGSTYHLDEPIFVRSPLQNAHHFQNIARAALVKIEGK